MSNNSFKIQLVFSIIMVVLIDILLTVIWLQKGIDITTYLFIVIALLTWPVAVFITFKQAASHVDDSAENSGRAPVKLSIVVWLLLSGVLLGYNFYLEGSLTWAFYPVAGITLWPLGMFLYNYLYKKLI
ncbi:MAG: hypothetical protein MI740_05155 [Halanaerobiales bacterium]|nr:hypothetical protein [Halanaerobiales bacterium]